MFATFPIYLARKIVLTAVLGTMTLSIPTAITAGEAKGYRATIFGMICAPAKGGSSRRLTRMDIHESLVTTLAVGHSIVREGGLSPEKIREQTGISRLSPEKNPSALVQAYQEMLHPTRSGKGKLSRILQVVPVTLAYANRHEEALRAAACVASLDAPGDHALRGTGRAVASILLNSLKQNHLSKKEIIELAIAECGNSEIAGTLRTVRTDHPVNLASANIADSLAVVLRAWYLGDSYSGCLNRLSSQAGPVRHALLGSLAGASHQPNIMHLPRLPGPRLTQEADGLVRLLEDMARDNILIPIEEDDVGVEFAYADIDGDSPNQGGKSSNSSHHAETPSQLTGTSSESEIKIAPIPSIRVSMEDTAHKSPKTYTARDIPLVESLTVKPVENPKSPSLPRLYKKEN